MKKEINYDDGLAIYDEDLQVFLDCNGLQYNYPTADCLYCKSESERLSEDLATMRKSYSSDNIYVVRVEFTCKFEKSNNHVEEVFSYKEFFLECHRKVSQHQIEGLIREHKRFISDTKKWKIKTIPEPIEQEIRRRKTFIKHARRYLYEYCNVPRLERISQGHYRWLEPHEVEKIMRNRRKLR